MPYPAEPRLPDPVPARVLHAPLPLVAVTAAATATTGGRAAPPVGWVVLAVVLYAAVLVPVVLWFLARVNRSNAAWVVLPLLALGTAVGFWFLGHSAPGSPATPAHRAAVTQVRP
jgi:hypothetical protein